MMCYHFVMNTRKCDNTFIYITLNLTDEGLLKVCVSWNATVDQAIVRSAEVNHRPRLSCATVGDL